MPTTAQALKCNLVTLDKRTENVVILAGEEINIEIEPNGEWRFV